MGTVVGSWRLRLIVVITIFIMCLYFTNIIFYNLDEVTEDGYIDWDNQNIDLGYNESEIGTEQGTDFISLIVGVGDFLTFGNIDNGFIRIFLNFIVAFSFLAIGYVIYTFIKEWVPLV